MSRDGTRIPYFLIRPREMRMDGSTPTLLYGYGGFQVSQVPAYSGTMGRLWLEQGNAYVVANLRGGGEFGPEWHQTAQLANKQRTWDDYIAVAEDLIRRADHLARAGSAWSAAARAACWSAPRSPSGRSCSTRRSSRCRCSTCCATI